MCTDGRQSVSRWLSTGLIWLAETRLAGWLLAVDVLWNELQTEEILERLHPGWRMKLCYPDYDYNYYSR